MAIQTNPPQLAALASKPQRTQTYLFGHPIAHSLSPILHDTTFAALQLPYTYTLYESFSIPSFLALTTRPDFLGSAVTMPHKVAIIPHLDNLTTEGKAIGAINTIFLRFPKSPSGAPDFSAQPSRIGTNTDCIGIREALLQNVPPPQILKAKGKPGMIIGGGGTCRAAVYALKHFLGCETVYILNRDASEVSAVVSECLAAGFGDNIIHVTSLSQASELPKPGLVISAIPDFEPRTENEIMARNLLGYFLSQDEGEEKGAVLEMCYHPSTNTAITRLAREKGWQVVPGTEAMIWQGVEQEMLWTGRGSEDLPVDDIKRMVQEALEKGANK
jgi:quinate dehydrogenase